MGEAQERAREQYDLMEHQSNFEVIRNRNIEEDHQMRSNLEEQIDKKRDRCNSQLLSYRTQTESNTQDYHTYLSRDAKSSKEVEQRLRQVQRLVDLTVNSRNCQKALATQLEIAHRIIHVA